MTDSLFFFCCAAPDNLNQHEGEIPRRKEGMFLKADMQDDFQGLNIKDVAALKKGKGFNGQDDGRDALRTQALLARESSTFLAKLDCSGGEAIGVKIFLMEPDDSHARDKAHLAVWRFPLRASLEGRSISLSCDLADARSVPLSMKTRLDREEDAIIGSVTEGGAVDSWNLKCPESQVIRAGDRIVEVNGEGGSAEDIARKLSNLQDSNKVELLIQRPRELAVKITKYGEPLGLDLRYIDAPFGLMISHVKDGLVRDWNLAHPTQSMNAYDRIVTVNGRTETPEKLIDMLKHLEELELKVLSWPNE